uniref:Protein phosphatase 2 regulatory subunit Balpha n=1 Tax=Felis catus TaxID=9685 RepID=A0ABI7ZBU5_FELCA
MGEDTDTRKINHSFLRDHSYVTEADIISTVEFNHTGELLATGDKGGRVVIFQREPEAGYTSGRSFMLSHKLKSSAGTVVPLPAMDSPPHCVEGSTARVRVGSSLPK